MQLAINSQQVRSPKVWVHKRTNASWSAMRERCRNPRHPGYAYYGGRGITVCERWLNSFANFLADMGPRPEGKTLDRFPNNDGNYEPGNCRWATARQQQANRRPSKRYLANKCPENVGVLATPISGGIKNRYRDIAGQRFGRLVAVKPTHHSKRKILYWLCNCDCGGTRIARQDQLRAGISKYCASCPVEELRTKDSQEAA